MFLLVFGKDYLPIRVVSWR